MKNIIYICVVLILSIATINCCENEDFLISVEDKTVMINDITFSLNSDIKTISGILGIIYKVENIPGSTVFYSADSNLVFYSKPNTKFVYKVKFNLNNVDPVGKPKSIIVDNFIIKSDVSYENLILYIEKMGISYEVTTYPNVAIIRFHNHKISGIEFAVGKKEHLSYISFK